LRLGYFFAAVKEAILGITYFCTAKVTTTDTSTVIAIVLISALVIFIVFWLLKITIQ
jgi:hypothetical protein